MRKRNHLLFVFRSLGTGGSQKIQAFVANACVKKGYEVTILSLSEKKCTLDIDPSINVMTLDYDKVALSKENPIKYLLNRLKYLLRYRKKVKNINPDVVIVFLIDIVRLTVLSLKGTGYPIIGSERADPSQFKISKIRQYNNALNKCVGVVYQLKEAANYYNIKPKVVQEVIPNPAIARNTNEKFGINQNDELFIFGAGRLEKQKRFDLLIDAFNIVHKVHPEYRLKIYGDGPEMKMLKNQVIHLKLLDYVDFMGDVRNIFQDTNDESIFVLSSDYEGIPNVITEALLNGVPCISTDCSPGGARLLLDNGKCGEIVQRSDAKELADAIIRYIENPSYAREKAKIGKRHIEKFNPEVIENKWLDFIERIIKNV